MVKNATWVLLCLILLLFLTALLGPPLLHLPELRGVLVGPEGLRIWAEHSASFIEWGGGIARSFFPWPFVVLLIVALFVMSKFTPQIEILARSLRRVEILGTKIEFSQETQPFVFEQFEKVNDFIVLYRRGVRDATQEQITREGLYEDFTRDIDSCFARIFDGQPRSSIGRPFILKTSCL